jgi:hypothetical protein
MRNLVQRGRGNASASVAVLFTADRGPGRGHLTGQYRQLSLSHQLICGELQMKSKGVTAIKPGALRWRFALQYPVGVKHPMD